MKRCILKLTLENQTILQFLMSSIQYYNHLYEENTEQAIFFETFQDGFLLIYKDLDTFLKIAKYRKEIMTSSADVIDYDINTLSEADFPKSGFTGYIEPIDVDFSVVFPVIKGYFDNLKQGFQVENFENKKIYLKCSSYSGFKALINTYFGRFIKTP